MKKWARMLAVSTLILGVNAQAQSDTVYMYNWPEYVPTGVLEEFTKETGIKVILSSFESNETMYAKLKTLDDKSGYDVIAPTNYFVSKMRKEGMLLKLDHSKLSNFKHLDPAVLNKPYDPDNQYSVPQVFGATGIAYNKDEVDISNISAWADLWKPEYKGQLQLMDDAREVFHIALVKLGFDPNTQNHDEIKLAYEELLKLRPNVLSFNSENPSNTFVSGEANLGMLWNGSAYVARSQGVPVNIIWPKEGGIFWMDTLAISKNAQNVEGAYKLIDFFLRPDIAAKVSLAIGYPTPNLTARGSLPADMVNDLNLYPNQEVLDTGIWQDDVGDATVIYEDYYQRLKVAK